MVIRLAKWLPNPNLGYTYHIPVCLHPNYNPNSGPPWDLTSPYHTAVNSAMGLWNSVGGELFFFRSNAECQDLFDAGEPYVQIGWGNIAGVGRADTYYTNCGASTCIRRVAIWLDNDKLYAFALADLNNRYHAQSVFSHEFGHAVGLGDVDNEADMMDQDIALEEINNSLSADDRFGYAYHYGTTH